jgi:hypothetical protein
MTRRANEQYQAARHQVARRAYELYESVVENTALRSIAA